MCRGASENAHRARAERLVQTPPPADCSSTQSSAGYVLFCSASRVCVLQRSVLSVTSALSRSEMPGRWPRVSAPSPTCCRRPRRPASPPMRIAAVISAPVWRGIRSSCSRGYSTLPSRSSSCRRSCRRRLRRPSARRHARASSLRGISARGESSRSGRRSAPRHARGVADAMPKTRCTSSCRAARHSRPCRANSRVRGCLPTSRRAAIHVASPSPPQAR